MKKINILLSSSIAVLLLSSCNPILDREMILTMTEKQALESYDVAQKRVNGLYTYLPNGFSPVGGAMMAAASDEAEYSVASSSVHMFNNGSWNPLNNPDNVWTYYYQGIRQATLFLETADQINMERYKLDPQNQADYEMRMANIERWKYEARFLRAYFYSELVKRYGGVPLANELMDMDTDYRNIPRNTLQECIDFIVDECGQVAPHLPAVYQASDMGRVTRGAALALKSRVLLYAASELFNNPVWAQGYERKDLIFVFNFNPKQSFTDYGFLVAPGAYEVILNTDNIAFGGNGFADDSVVHFTIADPLYKKEKKEWLKLYIPARTAVVLRKKK